MKLLEYEAKRILSTAGIPIPHSEIISADITPSFPLPFVLKSQVPTGGRGKAGGVVIIDQTDDIAPAIERLLQLEINSHIPTTLLVEEKLSTEKEFYLSLLVNRASQRVTLMANRGGGIEVEENVSESYLRLPISSETNFQQIGQQLSDYFECPEQANRLQDLIQKLYTSMVKNDALLIEVNPLVLTAENHLIVADAKITLDDAAEFRHPEWRFETPTQRANFVTLDQEGTVATIANGAGLAMATVDAVSDAGLQAANFLDIGGGASADTLLAAFRQLRQYPNLKAIVINIFAGITRSDEIAKAIITAQNQIDQLPPLFIRLAGTGYEEASLLLKEANIPLLPSLEECIDAAQSTVKGAA